MRIEDAVDLEVERFESNPLITPDSDERLGPNVNGPSVIRVPEWIEDPLGEYYLYFAAHDGQFIRLAYADDPRGPWTVHSPGTLHMDETKFNNHVASPDVHVDHDEERLVMYFHGCSGPPWDGWFDHPGNDRNQTTDVATSTDGLDFEVRAGSFGDAYFRVFEYRGAYYAIGGSSSLYRADGPLGPFERLQELIPESDTRHVAVRFPEADLLQVALSRRGDRPERLMVATIDLSKPIEEWRADPHPPETVLWPERDYEGGGLPLATSSGGGIHERVRELRDPHFFEDDGETYLYYAIAGEHGIAGATVRE